MLKKNRKLESKKRENDREVSEWQGERRPRETKRERHREIEREMRLGVILIHISWHPIGGLENFVSIVSARGGLAKMNAYKMLRKRRENEKKRSFKSKHSGIQWKTWFIKEWFGILRGLFKKKFSDGA